MSTEKKLIIAALVVLALTIIASAAERYEAVRAYNLARSTPERSISGTTSGTGVVCTLEAKICPDGTAVGRTGPNCEFAPCPESAGASTGNATSTSGRPGGPLLTGELVGTVMLGPTCPVEQNPPSPQCADKPYQTVVGVSTGGREVGRQQTDAQGRFMFAFLPGTYTVTALGGNPLPRCAPQTVTLTKAATTTVEISCDTGIR